MEKKSKLLTIGQFASLHGINKKTLMWYDEIGLFHPAFIHPENGYRYYSYHQSSCWSSLRAKSPIFPIPAAKRSERTGRSTPITRCQSDKAKI